MCRVRLCGIWKKNVYSFFNLHELIFMAPETAGNEVVKWSEWDCV